MESGIWKSIERAANLGILAIVCAMLWQARPGASLTPGSPPRMVAVGDALDVAGFDWKSREVHLFVAFRSSCQICVDELPVYQELSGKIGLTFLTPVGEVSELKRFLADRGTGAAQVVGVDYRSNKLVVTPLLVVAGADRTVRSVWRGRLREQQRAEIETDTRPSSERKRGS